MKHLKRHFALLTAAVMLLTLVGCQKGLTEAPEAGAAENTILSGDTNSTAQEGERMRITIGEYEFAAQLEDNQTANALREQLPLRLEMSELNGNEKYNYLTFDLPTDTYAPRQIQAGDIMLYGNSCLVVFYESFSTPYSYTRIGRIEDVTNLRSAVGTGDVEMVFENVNEDLQ